MESYANQQLTDISSLARRLRSNDVLHTLDLRHNKLTDKDALELASVLCTNHSLTALNLSYNRITDQGLGHLITALKHQPTLRILHIGGNLDCTTRHVAELLKLDLSHLLYTGTYVMEVDQDLLTKWPPKSFDELVHQCRPSPPPGHFHWVSDPTWRHTCQTAYNTCDGFQLWTFFRSMIPPRTPLIEWQPHDDHYFQWRAVHEIMSLSLVHHPITLVQYEQLLRMLQCIARKGWDHYCRSSTCKSVE